MINNHLRIFLALLILIEKTKTQTNHCDYALGEVYFNEWCYKLTKLTSNQTQCDSLTNKLEYFVCLKGLLMNLIKVYTNQYFKSDSYEFTLLNSKHHSIWHSLIDKYFVTNGLNKSQYNDLNIFVNIYSTENKILIENEQINDENPNLMIHNDQEMNPMTVEKCIYGHQVKMNNESFHFKYGDCEKKLPFICIKPVHKTNETNSDRCLNYRQQIPGGNWVECDKLNIIFSNRYRNSGEQDDLKISESQKCCLYNIKWQENYVDALKFCSLLDSSVFSYKVKGYKSILENYASYLNLNYGKPQSSNVVNISVDFWTSCKKGDLFDICEQDDNLNKFSSLNLPVYLKQSGLELFYYNSNLNLSTFDQKQLNITSLFKVLNENSDLIQSEFSLQDCTIDLFKCFQLSVTSFLKKSLILVKQRPQNLQNKLFYLIDPAIKFNVESNISSLSSDCFFFKENVRSNSIYISIPFLNDCYHFTLFTSQSLNSQHLKQFNEQNEQVAISKNVLTSLLDILGITKIKCLNVTSNGSQFFTNFYLNVTKYDDCFSKITKLTQLSIQSFNKITSTQNRSSWLGTLMKKYRSETSVILVLHSMSSISKVLSLNCIDRALDLIDVIDICLKFYDYKFCQFTCPLNCKFDEKILWQIRPFKYFFMSSICHGAYHSNINKGYFYVSSNKNFNEANQSFSIVNNHIRSNIWPPYMIESKHLNLNKINLEKHFFFSASSITIKNQNDVDYSHNEFLVVLPAAKLIKSSSMANNNILIKFYNFDSTDLKYKFKKLINVDDYKNGDLFNLQIQNKSNPLNLNIQVDSIEDIKNLNDFFEVEFFSNHTKLNNRLMFPINFLLTDEDYFMPNENSIFLGSNSKHISFLNVSLINNKIKKFSCYWSFMDRNISASCLNVLTLKNFNLNTIKDSNELISIFYPNNGKLKTFTRILIKLNETKCQNDGAELLISSNNSKCLCLPGFGGERCQNICEENFFGTNCEYLCPMSDCRGYLFCNQDPLGCSCASGLKGYLCDQECQKDEWGPGCRFRCDSNCINGCNRINGTCLCHNSKTTGKKCNECLKGYYGNNCSKKCDSNCEGGVCHKLNGFCINKSKICNDISIQNDSIAQEFFVNEKMKINFLKVYDETCQMNHGCFSNHSKNLVFINIDPFLNKHSSSYIYYLNDSNQLKFVFHINISSLIKKLEVGNNASDTINMHFLIFDSRVSPCYLTQVIKSNLIAYKFLSNVVENMHENMIIMTAGMTQSGANDTQSDFFNHLLMQYETNEMNMFRLENKKHYLYVLYSFQSRKTLESAISLDITDYKCPNGYWSPPSCHKKCGLCAENETCNYLNGTCKTIKCLNELMESPYCDKCKPNNFNYPLCNETCDEKMSLHFCGLHSIKTNYFDELITESTSNINLILIFLLIFTLTATIIYKVCTNYKKEISEFTFDLDFNLMLAVPTKSFNF